VLSVLLLLAIVLSVLLLLAIVLSVLLRYIYSDYPFWYLQTLLRIIWRTLPTTIHELETELNIIWICTWINFWLYLTKYLLLCGSQNPSFRTTQDIVLLWEYEETGFCKKKPLTLNVEHNQCKSNQVSL
jgi:hypothetical protein